MVKNIDINLARMQELESRFKLNNYHGNSNLLSHSFISGKDSKIMIGAPHSVKTSKIKKGVELEKKEEVWTGSICLLMGELLGCHVMVRNNYTDVLASDRYYNPYLIEYIQDMGIKYYIDLHGASKKCSFDIAPGTNNGEYIERKQIYRDILVDSFNKYGIKDINFNTKFQASTPVTLCNQVWSNCHIKTTQLEVHRRYRNPLEDFNTMGVFISGLASYIWHLENYEEGKIYGKKIESK